MEQAFEREVLEKIWMIFGGVIVGRWSGTGPVWHVDLSSRDLVVFQQPKGKVNLHVEDQIFFLQVAFHLSPHVRESMTVLDSGFHPVDSGFRVLDSGFQLSGFRIPKKAGFQIFFCFKCFSSHFVFVFESCYIERRCLECINSLFSFSIYKLREEMLYCSGLR